MAFKGARAGKQFGTSHIASEAITKFYVVKHGSSDGQVDLNDTAGEACMGVAQQKAASGQDVKVCRIGLTQVVAGGAITKGARIQGDGTGKVTTAASGDYCIGIADEAASASGDTITAFINTGHGFDLP